MTRDARRVDARATAFTGARVARVKKSALSCFTFTSNVRICIRVERPADALLESGGVSDRITESGGV